MKKIIAIVCGVLLIASLAYAQSRSTAIRFDGSAYSGNGLLKMIIASQKAQSSFRIHDGGSTSDPQLIPLIQMYSSDSLCIPVNIPFGKGLYVDVTSDGSLNVMLYYETR